MIPTCKNGDSLICSVCGKKFIADKNTVYITNGGFTCTWDCFINPIKEKEKKKKELLKLKEAQEKENESINEEVIIIPSAKKRGRPAKQKLNIKTSILEGTKKKRGRPKKQN